MNFTAGQTEVWISPPADDYTLRLELVNTVTPDSVMARAEAVNLKVVSR